MSTLYSPLLGYALPTTGELAGSWGDVVNSSITQLVEDSVAGYATADVTSGNWTLSTTGAGVTNQARMMILIATGTPGTARNIIAPSSSKMYIVANLSDSAVTLKGSATTGVVVPAGSTALVSWVVSDFEVISDVIGPASSTANAVPTFFGTTGKVIQNNSGVTIASGVLAASGVKYNDGDSSNFIQIVAPTTVTTDTVLSLPNGAAASGQALGYIDVPQNSQSANYTLVLSDSGKHIYHPSADTTPRTFTIPANSSVAFPVGTAIGFVNDTGAGAVTIAITSDTLIAAGTGATGSRTLAASSIATAIKITSTSWMITGVTLT